MPESFRSSFTNSRHKVNVSLSSSMRSPKERRCAHICGSLHALLVACLTTLLKAQSTSGLNRIYFKVEPSQVSVKSLGMGNYLWVIYFTVFLHG